MSKGPHFNAELMLKASALRAHGLSWKDTADRLSVNPHSLETAHCRWRKGKVGSRWGQTTLIERWVHHVEKEGRSARWIADKYGRSIQGVSVSLARKGLDAEMRRMWADYHAGQLGSRAA